MFGAVPEGKVESNVPWVKSKVFVIVMVDLSHLLLLWVKLGQVIFGIYCRSKVIHKIKLSRLLLPGSS